VKGEREKTLTIVSLPPASFLFGSFSKEKLSFNYKMPYKTKNEIYCAVVSQQVSFKRKL
jgi:hypothetical protein